MREIEKEAAYRFPVYYGSPFIRQNRAFIAGATSEAKHSEGRIKELEGERKRLYELINNPEIQDFIKGMTLEAAHQTERWGLEHENSQPPHHFVLVVTKIAGKMCGDVWDYDVEKFKHHCIALAAVMANVHAKIDKGGTAINDWFKLTEQTEKP